MDGRGAGVLSVDEATCLPTVVGEEEAAPSFMARAPRTLGEGGGAAGRGKTPAGGRRREDAGGRTPAPEENPGLGEEATWGPDPIWELGFLVSGCLYT
jgi:hypothetical protein